MIQDNQFDILLASLSNLLSHKQVPRMWVRMDKSFFKNHENEGIRDDLSQFLHINSTLIYLLDMRDRNALFEGHHEDSLTGIFFVNLRNVNVGVVREDFSTLLGVAGFSGEVELEGQTLSELMR